MATAMRRRGSRGRLSAQGQRRKFIWARQSGTGIVSAGDTAADGIAIDLLENFKAAYDADPIGCTIMRIRGQILINGEAVGPGGEVELVTGVRTFTEPIGPNEEGPLDTPHADWMMYQPSRLLGSADDAASGSQSWYNKHRYDVDVRSNRKMEELGQGLLLRLQHDVSATALSFGYNLSVGLKLP